MSDDKQKTPANDAFFAWEQIEQFGDRMRFWYMDMAPKVYPENLKAFDTSVKCFDRAMLAVKAQLMPTSLTPEEQELVKQSAFELSVELQNQDAG